MNIIQTINEAMLVTRLQTLLRSSPFGRALRAIVGVAAWGLLLFILLLTLLLAAWVLLAVVLLGSGPATDTDGPTLVVLAVLLALTGGLAWLVARYVAPARRVVWTVGSILALLLIIGTTWALSSPDQALFLARDMAWSESDVWDYQKFPERVVNNASPVFRFKESPARQLFQTMTMEYTSEGEPKQANFEEFLRSTQTTSFIVIKDDAILYEGYFNGYARDSIVTSFSVAKSFTSALVGIAIDEGYIGTVNDPMVYYLPELRGKGLDGVTIRHLLTMSSGIRYMADDEISGLAQIWPFSDDTLSYYYPNLRSQALELPPDGKQPGTEFNYNLQLLGMILERTTHRAVAEYLQEPGQQGDRVPEDGERHQRPRHRLRQVRPSVPQQRQLERNASRLRAMGEGIHRA